MLFEMELEPKAWMKDYRFILVQSIPDLEVIINSAIKSGFCALDTESTGLDVRAFNGKCCVHVVGYSISFEPKVGYYIPIRHKAESEKGCNLDSVQVNALIQKLVSNCIITGHYLLKYDAELMEMSEGITFPKVEAGQDIPYHDTYILARLAGMSPAGLKYLSKTRLGKEMFDLKDLFAGNHICFDSLKPQEGLLYAASDAIMSYELFFDQEIQRPIKEQLFIYNLERKVMGVVRKMERNKIKLDMNHAQELSGTLMQQLDDVAKQIFTEVEAKTNGQIKQFNIHSNKELAYILFDIYDMSPKPEKGKDGVYSTNRVVLEDLALTYPLANKIMEFRTAAKFHSTYIKNMLLNVDSEGYLKFNFKSLGTDTGRFSSPKEEEVSEDSSKSEDGYSGVNLQATPSRYDITKPNVRKCFTCEDDEVIAALDWSGVELRVAANMSKEPIWLDRFLHGDGDLHLSTAAIIYNLSESEAYDKRNIGKTFNFQTLFGGGPGAIAKKAGISIDEAKRGREAFFGKLTVLKKWIKDLQKQAYKDGFCLTAFGRKRLLPEIQSPINEIRAKGERQAVNSPVQGSAGDLMKIAMVKIDEYIDKNNLTDTIKMLATIHDELMFRVKKNNLNVLRQISEVMCLDPILQKIKWEVPLKVDAEVGKSWDVQYEYSAMLKFLKTVKNIENISYLYTLLPENYEILLREYSLFKKYDFNQVQQYLKERKLTLTAVCENVSDYNLFVKEFKEYLKTGEIAPHTNKLPEELMEKPTQEIVTFSDSTMKALVSVEGGGEIVTEQDNISLNDTVPVEKDENIKLEGAFEEATFHPNLLKLKDLPVEEYTKLKKQFYQSEYERLLSGTPSTDDLDLEFFAIVHNPIDESKAHTLEYIFNQCQGSSKVKLITQNKEVISDEWRRVDIIKFSVLWKIYHI